MCSLLNSPQTLAPTSSSDCQKDSRHPQNAGLVFFFFYKGGLVFHGKKHIGTGLSVNHALALSLETAWLTWLCCVTVAQNIVSHGSSVPALVARISIRAPLCGLTGPGVELSSGTCKGGATASASKAPCIPSQWGVDSNILENKDAKPVCG